MEEFEPSLSEFRRIAARLRRPCRIPVMKVLPAGSVTAVETYLRLRRRRPSFLLESVEGNPRLARYSYIGCGPVPRIRLSSPRVGKDPFAEIRRALAAASPPAAWLGRIGVPRFWGGAVGYLSYETIRFFERLPETRRSERPGLPTGLFLLTDLLVCFDHAAGRVHLISAAPLGRGLSASRAYDRARTRISRLEYDLIMGKYREPGPLRAGAPKPDLSAKEFERKVRAVKRYIRAGDVVQAVISRRFEVPVSGDPFCAYVALRRLNPSPYMYYLDFGRFVILGSSPEILVRREGNRALVRPIAGTRPRASASAKDRRLERQLRADPKERAEHLMLVDLARNDLGRVSCWGSVRLRRFMAVERYSHVMHLVSDVEGLLRPGEDSFSLVRATFPAGTVTGAPKVRAMEIIDELERARRGPYAGGVGYFSYGGDCDFAITIRTAVCANGRAYVQAGAGIVADSVPAREVRETESKAAAMLEALRQAGSS